MTREQMIDVLIVTFGFEDSRTVEFSKLCERYEDNEYNNKFLKGVFNSLLDLSAI